MTDKHYIVHSAREYAKKGKIDKAITEWSKLLTFSKDGHVCNNIGDLYIKKEAQDEAINSQNHNICRSIQNDKTVLILKLLQFIIKSSPLSQTDRMLLRH